MRLLGVDAGERRMGLAVSDPLGTIASPLRVIDRTECGDPIEEILREAAACEAEGIVVGMPLTLRGEMGPAAARIERFIEQLRERSSLPVYVVDERLTTKAAEHDMAGAGLSSRQRRGSVDKVAAALILQRYLDAHRAGAAPREHLNAPEVAARQSDEQ